MNHRPIVVLGGGPAGMSAAWHLTKAGRRVVVLEKAEQVGGLGATVTMNGFRLDYGPHVLSVRETPERSEERRVGKECRSRWSPYH